MPIRKGHVAPQHTLIESIIRKFDSQNRSYILGNAQSLECSIIYCSDNFCRMSGFSRAEVMQKSALCPFLHGPLTSSIALQQIRQSLLGEQERHMELLYYKKDGTRFFCSQLVAPIRDEIGDICLYVLNFEDLTVTSQDEAEPAETPNLRLSRFDRARQSVRQSLRRKGSGRTASVKSRHDLPTIPAGEESPPSLSRADIDKDKDNANAASANLVIEPKVQIPPSSTKIQQQQQRPPIKTFQHSEQSSVPVAHPPFVPYSSSRGGGGMTTTLENKNEKDNTDQGGEGQERGHHNFSKFGRKSGRSSSSQAVTGRSSSQHASNLSQMPPPPLVPPTTSATFPQIQAEIERNKELGGGRKLSHSSSRTFSKPSAISYGIPSSDSASFTPTIPTEGGGVGVGGSLGGGNREPRRDSSGFPSGGRDWASGGPVSTPSTVTAQSIAQLRNASSLDRIQSGSVTTQLVQIPPSRASTTANLSANIFDWKGNGHLLVRPHTTDNIYLKAEKSQAKGFRNVSNSDSDLARHRISVIDPKICTTRDKKSPSLSNLTHQDGLSRYKMSIQENGSGKFFQGVKVGEKVAQT